MKYFSWFLGLIAIVVVVIIGAIMLRNIFRDGSASSSAPARTTMVADHIEADTTLRLRIDGPVVANENHESAIFDISKTGRAVTFYRGFDRANVIRHTSYGNNTEAFTAFAYALDRMGYTAEVSGVNQHRGQCADGQVYHMELLKDGRTIKSLWATSCGDRGSFAGYLDPVTRLFENQFPDFSSASDGTIFHR